MEYTCYFCNSRFERYSSQVQNPQKVCCSRKCTSNIYKTKYLGKKNPNYKTGRFFVAHFCLDCNRLIDKAGRSKRCYKCSSKLKNNIGRPHTKESKLLIGKKSSEKFTPEFKLKFRNTMEKKGIWVPLEKKSKRELYFSQANWIKSMINFMSKYEINLINKHGLFSSKNPNGVVRDHKLSRDFGFKYKVFPEILRHPCNCEIIFHRDNVKKRFINNDNSTSLERLFTEIIMFKRKWKEQYVCLVLILEYLNGKRWRV